MNNDYDIIMIIIIIIIIIITTIIIIAAINTHCYSVKVSALITFKPFECYFIYVKKCEFIVEIYEASSVH